MYISSDNLHRNLYQFGRNHLSHINKAKNLEFNINFKKLLCFSGLKKIRLGPKNKVWSIYWFFIKTQRQTKNYKSNECFWYFSPHKADFKKEKRLFFDFLDFCQFYFKFTGILYSITFFLICCQKKSKKNSKKLNNLIWIIFGIFLIRTAEIFFV